MHLVVSSWYGQHVADLAPADLPERYVLLFWDFDVLSFPGVCLAILLPYLARCVFWAASDHFTHQPNIATPCHVSHPICVLSNQFKLFRGLTILVFKLPHNYFVIISPGHKSFVWGLKFARCFVVCLARAENSRLSRRSPTNSVDAFLVCHKLMLYCPINCVLLWSEDKDFAFSSSCSEDQPVLPRSPGNTVDWWLQVLTENTVLPISIIVSSENFYLVVVATGCDDTLILWVCPSHLPRRPTVGIE